MAKCCIDSCSNDAKFANGRCAEHEEGNTDTRTREERLVEETKRIREKLKEKLKKGHLS